MKWSWKIGRFAGIDVFIHATFLLIIAWVAWSYWRITQTAGGTLEGIGFTLLLFLCVVLHEFGHALTARKFGVKPAISPFTRSAGLPGWSACPKNRCRNSGLRLQVRL